MKTPPRLIFRPVLVCVAISLLLISISAGRPGNSAAQPAINRTGDAGNSGQKTTKSAVQPGASVLFDKHLVLLLGKKVGVVCNRTSMLPNGEHLVDALQASRINVTALFGPEHGIRGEASAGATVTDQRDSKTGLPVFSLYGKTKKPTPEMMKDVDILLFDLQDVGARYYTYVSTMAYCMQACAEQHKTFVVLDRPNPINGYDIEGPIIDSTLRSFIGFWPVPIRHGMTLGELAKMALGEGWLPPAAETRPLDLKVIRMAGWQRGMWYDETGLPWIPPSPNMKTTATATVYPGTCLFEATNVSEGRGTPRPFEFIGAPWIEEKSLADKLNARHLPGVSFEPTSFAPASDSIAAPSPRFKSVACGGVFVHVTNRAAFRPVQTGMTMLTVMSALFPGKLKITDDNFERLLGVKGMEQQILSGVVRPLSDTLWHSTTDQFRAKRAKYLLY